MRYKWTLLLLVSLFTMSLVQSANAETKWVTSKKEAIERAKKQGKFILLMEGNLKCSYCNSAKKLLAAEPLNSLLNDSYILWFAEVSKMEGRPYRDFLPKSDYTAFPYLYIIDPNDPDKPISQEDPDNPYKSFKGKVTKEFLAGFLANGPTANKPDGTEDWILTKDYAFEQAQESGKQLFLFCWSPTCGICEDTRDSLFIEPFSGIIEKDYIIWYSNYRESHLKAEAQSYIDEIKNEAKLLPMLFIIDPENPEKSLRSGWGRKNKEELEVFLTGDDGSVSNEAINTASTQVYISNNTLTISNDISSETIRVFDISGQQIDTFIKKEIQLNQPVSNYPKGVLIIHSSAGWTTKVVNK